MECPVKRSASTLPFIFGCLVYAQLPDTFPRAITQVTEHLYRAQAGAAYSVFLVTPEGILLADPISTEYAGWLKAEIQKRFGLPVRYVIYSHHHWDHASGGTVFADTAQFVGHKAMPHLLKLPPPDTPLPPSAAGLDANRDSKIDPVEARDLLKALFPLYDADGDGMLNGAEVVRGPLNDVRPPDLVYSDRKTISLGGKTVELIYMGPTEAEDQTLLRFPEERAVYFVDFISLRRVPYRSLPGYDLEDLFAKIRAVEALDFDIAMGGHGSVGNKADVTAFRNYLEELRNAVARGIAAGKSLADLQKEITMGAYRHWENYVAWRAENVAGMFALLRARPRR
jgi:glyoxylase-like metal-dependent hydrolase (beta-lactamase superfamily II)